MKENLTQRNVVKETTKLMHESKSLKQNILCTKLIVLDHLHVVIENISSDGGH